MNMLIANLNLTKSSGRSMRISDYRQKKNLVILFTDAPDFGLLSGLVNAMSERYAEFRAEEAEILVVVRHLSHSLARLQTGLPYPVVTVQGDGINSKTSPANLQRLTSATIFVLDRYGEVYATYLPDDLVSVPTVDDLLEWLQFIELQCPE